MSLQRLTKNNIQMCIKIRNLERSLFLLLNDTIHHHESGILISREIVRLKKSVDHNNLKLSVYDCPTVDYK